MLGLTLSFRFHLRIRPINLLRTLVDYIEASVDKLQVLLG